VPVVLDYKLTCQMDFAEALNHGSYLVNISPSTAINLQILEEILWTIQPYEFSVAWHIVWLIVRKVNKLESKSKKCIFIGFTKGVKRFRLWDPETRSTFISIDAVLMKNQC